VINGVLRERDLDSPEFFPAERPLDTLAFSSPHAVNRHDAGSRGAGGDCRRGKIASGLSNRVWTIKELIERAAEA
jgi:hypothetical protein